MSIKLELLSGSFDSGSQIPRQYTCDGENISPALSWTASDPLKIQSYVLIIDDPDAQKVMGKTFVHWAIALPSTITSLPEGISTKEKSSLESLDPAAKEFPNDFDNTSYEGPCPPADHGKHTYRFTLFATTQAIDEMSTAFFKKPFTAENFKSEMADHIVASDSIIGNYKRAQS